MDYAIVFLPLLGSILSGFFGRKIGDRFSQLITSFFVTLSAILSMVIFYEVVVNQTYINHEIFSWINSGEIKVNWSINIDPLTSIMLVTVCLVSSLVHIYSIGYMSRDPNIPRFMSYLSLFTFAMIVLVILCIWVLVVHYGWM